MADGYSKYSVPRVQEKRMDVHGPKGGANDMVMKNPARVGAAKNPASSPDKMFGREFSAEADFKTLYEAKRVMASKGRYGAAMAFGMKLKKAGAGLNERGPTNHTVARGGSPRRDSNSFDNVPNAGKGTSGTKMDGQKGRW
jgi:hypothetical protein